MTMLENALGYKLTFRCLGLKGIPHHTRLWSNTSADLAVPEYWLPVKKINTCVFFKRDNSRGIFDLVLFLSMSLATQWAWR